MHQVAQKSTSTTLPRKPAIILSNSARSTTRISGAAEPCARVPLAQPAQTHIAADDNTASKLAAPPMRLFVLDATAKLLRSGGGRLTAGEGRLDRVADELLRDFVGAHVVIDRAHVH